ncbi:hypothetical protein TNCV_2733891 [Trichonephila clavipes]|nr:hypothetical protein TNCV_2733891 [Trichonephila clavipes]
MPIWSPRPSLIIFQDTKPLKGEKNSEKHGFTVFEHNTLGGKNPFGSFLVSPRPYEKFRVVRFRSLSRRAENSVLSAWWVKTTFEKELPSISFLPTQYEYFKSEQI